MDQAVGAKEAMINLKDVIEVERAEVLNADPKTNVKSILTGTGVLRSDASVDAQLLLKLTFREPVKLRGFRLLSTSASSSSSSASVATENADGHTESAPRTLKLFVNKPNLTFADADSLTPTEVLHLSRDDVRGDREIRVKFVKYQNVTALSLLIEDNQDDAEVTAIHRLELIGATIATMNVSELKKQGEEH